MAPADQPSAQRLPKLQVANIWDQAYQLLKERILARQFGANEKLLIPELAEQLGISRTPIRDALIRLEMEGLVRTVSKVGTFVNPVQEDNVIDIMACRDMIDSWTIDRLALLPQDRLRSVLAEAAAIVEIAEQAILRADDDNKGQANFDLDFHLAFVGAAGNRKNVEMYRNLMHYRFLNFGGALVTREMMARAVEQHRAILDSMLTGDSEATKRVLREHLDYSSRNIRLAIEQNGGEI
ncbi:GntR family transcriptional regulator [Paenibacillus cymbidii]|uniref:GntR family transcriptional regulator n=1 Tax=Paenibacillus cymbidii TaxID=1639034 RepID=UPI001436B26E|nr:GntR family transcriptional regulator [Paenibacillus cymbidii]